jgi:hypothetical protein
MPPPDWSLARSGGQSRDVFGNDSTVGLPASLNLNVSLTSGTGPLQGASSLDIGTAAGNGTASFSNLRIDAASTNNQLTAIANGSVMVLAVSLLSMPASDTG